MCSWASSAACGDLILKQADPRRGRPSRKAPGSPPAPPGGNRLAPRLRLLPGARAAPWAASLLGSASACGAFGETQLPSPPRPRGQARPPSGLGSLRLPRDLRRPQPCGLLLAGAVPAPGALGLGACAAFLHGRAEFLGVQGGWEEFLGGLGREGGRDGPGRASSEVGRGRP